VNGYCGSFLYNLNQGSCEVEFEATGVTFACGSKKESVIVWKIVQPAPEKVKPNRRKPMGPTPKKLLDQACTELCQSVRDAIRLKPYSIRTEQAYVNWIKRDVTFHNVRHPAEMGATEIQAFLTHLAVEGNVAASFLEFVPFGFTKAVTVVLHIETPNMPD
jgi:hypothetical protein